MKTAQRLSCAILALLTAATTLFKADAQPTIPPAHPSFSIVVLPDTQNYANVRLGYAAKHWKKGDLSANFLKQTEWIKQNVKNLNIAMVMHVGDMTQTDYDKEWNIVDQAFKTLDGVVPYCIVQGNHDMGFDPANLFRWHPTFANSRTTEFNKHFPPSRFEKTAWYGGHYGDGNENSFCLFEAAGLKFMVVALEFKPRDEAIAWANKIIAEHPDRRCIILTHGYLDENNKLSATLDYGVQGNAGAAIWEKLVSLHRNIFLVVCSHEYGERRLTSQGKNGNTVYQVSADYEDQNGGQGYLRIMTFVPAKSSIDVKTYSPVLDQYQTGTNSQFSLEYPMK